MGEGTKRLKIVRAFLKRPRGPRSTWKIETEKKTGLVDRKGPRHAGKVPLAGREQRGRVDIWKRRVKERLRKGNSLAGERRWPQVIGGRGGPERGSKGGGQVKIAGENSGCHAHGGGEPGVGPERTWKCQGRRQKLRREW